MTPYAIIKSIKEILTQAEINVELDARKEFKSLPITMIELEKDTPKDTSSIGIPITKNLIISITNLVNAQNKTFDNMLLEAQNYNDKVFSKLSEIAINNYLDYQIIELGETEFGGYAVSGRELYGSTTDITIFYSPLQ